MGEGVEAGGMGEHPSGTRRTAGPQLEAQRDIPGRGDALGMRRSGSKWTTKSYKSCRRFGSRYNISRVLRALQLGPERTSFFSRSAIVKDARGGTIRAGGLYELIISMDHNEWGARWFIPG